MKVFSTLLLLFSLFTFQVAAQSTDKSEEVVVKTEIFCNHCNYCETCKPQIETALFAISGVKQAKLDIETQSIKVVFNPKKTSAEEIRKAILASGYAADGVQPTAEAHSKLEACCQRK